MAPSIRHFLTLEDLSNKELLGLMDLAAHVKKKPNQYKKALKGQTLGMIFEKNSTRTRVSFEVGMFQLGGHAIFLNSNDIQMGRGETIADTAKVLSRYVDGIMIRTFEHQTVEELAQNATVPVINGLTDSYHPCQILADLQTLQEHYGKLKGLQMVFVGDGNNVAHSLMMGAAKTGMHMKLICPEGYEPDASIQKRVEKVAEKTGSHIEITHKIQGSLKGTDVVYTDVWTSMGQEAEKVKRLNDFKGFEVNEKLMSESPRAVFLHCLPAHRGEEVSAGVMDGKQSRVFDQAENRLHAQKALLIHLMGSGREKA